MVGFKSQCEAAREEILIINRVTTIPSGRDNQEGAPVGGVGGELLNDAAAH